MVQAAAISGLNEGDAFASRIHDGIPVIVRTGSRTLSTQTAVETFRALYVGNPSTPRTAATNSVSFSFCSGGSIA